MAGLTDVPFRTLAWHYGAAYMVSEMVSDKPQLWETGKSRLRRQGVPGMSPSAVQIAGTDPQVMADAARRHADDGVEVIDINFGCPAKKVCKQSAGSALLADIGLLGRIVESVAKAVALPVTIKTRTGLVPGDGLGCAAAITAESAGAQLVTIHARSRACHFKGVVDYPAVARITRAVSIPVLVNGDITTAAEARLALHNSCAAGVMVGRGAIGQPWIFRELDGKPKPDYHERWAVVLEHVQSIHEFYGQQPGLQIARKHIVAYANLLGFDVRACLRLERPEQQLKWLNEARDRMSERQKNYEHHSERAQAA